MTMNQLHPTAVVFQKWWTKKSGPSCDPVRSGKDLEELPMLDVVLPNATLTCRVSKSTDDWKNKLFTVENSPTARRGYHSAVGEKSCSYWSVWKKEISYRSLLLDADKKVFPCKAHWKFLATNLVSSWLPEAGFTKNRKLCKNQPLPIHPLTLPVDFGRNQTCHFLFWAGENPQHGSSFGRFRRESRRF